MQQIHCVSLSAPCPPDGVEVQLMPVQMDVQEMRFHWNQIDCDNTTYLLKLTGSLLGDSEAQFELSSYWTGRTFFEMPLPCGSAYQATVESRNTAGTSAPSVPLTGTTGKHNLRLFWFIELFDSWNWLTGCFFGDLTCTKSTMCLFLIESCIFCSFSSNRVWKIPLVVHRHCGCHGYLCNCSLDVNYQLIFRRWLWLLLSTSAPCPPSGVTHTGDNLLSSIAWSPSVFATTYTVYDVSVTPRVPVCSTGQLQCSLSNNNSTNLVIVASNSAGESEVTQVPRGTNLCVCVSVCLSECVSKECCKMWANWCSMLPKLSGLNLFSSATAQGRRRRDLSKEMANNGTVDLQELLQ